MAEVWLVKHPLFVSAGKLLLTAIFVPAALGVVAAAYSYRQEQRAQKETKIEEVTTALANLRAAGRALYISCVGLDENTCAERATVATESYYGSVEKYDR